MKLLSEQVDEKEIAVILRELSKTKEISGDVVEFGCFVGTTSVFLAKEIEKWNAEKMLWLYDSFEGLPEKSREDENSLGEVFKKGELLMIVGPSGCGKTTLLSVIAGTLRFDSGTVGVFNYKLETMTEGQVTEFRKSNVGFIFQQFHLKRE